MSNTENSQRRFGFMLYPDRPIDELVERAKTLEAFGIDQIYIPDHSADLRNRSGYWLEAMTTLAVLARETTHIRVGTLVANMIMRHPVMFAKQAVAVDQASDGRLELGIGTGVFEWDHDAMGTEAWSTTERTERLHEFLHIVDGVMRESTNPFSFDGDWYKTSDIARNPGSTQRPRAPILVGGQSTNVLKAAARYGDIWNTIGPMDASAEEILNATARQNTKLSELLISEGRDPASVRRSFAYFGAWNPWESDNPYAVFETLVHRFSEVGFQDFVLEHPPGREDEFERIAVDLIPKLREILIRESALA